MRIDEDTIGHGTAGGDAIAAVEKICLENAEVIVGDMRKCGSSFDVARGIDAGSRCFELLVHCDVSSRIDGNASRGKIQRMGIGLAARGDEQIGAFDGAVSALRRYRQADAGTGTRN